MARKQDENLIPQAHKLTVEEASRGAQKSAETKRRRKTIGNILKQWSNFAVSDKQAEQLKKMGFSDDDLVNSTLVAVKLIQKIQGGDLKAMEMYVKLTGQDPETEAKIAKTKQETRLVKAEEQKIKNAFGDDREFEDLAGLAEMLKGDDEE